MGLRVFESNLRQLVIMFLLLQHLTFFCTTATPCTADDVMQFVIREDLAEVDKCLVENPDLDLRNQSGETALMIVCNLGQMSIAKRLLQHKLSPSPDSFIESFASAPLHAAVLNGHLDLVRFILQRPSTSHSLNVNVQDRNGFSALHFAVHTNNLPLVQLLLDHQPQLNLNLREVEGDTALQMAVDMDHTEIVYTFLQRRYRPRLNLDNQGKQGMTALAHAALKGRVDLVRLLLQQRPAPNINIPDAFDAVPIVLAITNGHHAVADALSQHQPPPSLPDRRTQQILIGLLNRAHQVILANRVAGLPVVHDEDAAGSQSSADKSEL